MGDVAFVVVTGFRLCGAADQYEKENQKQLQRCRKSQLSAFHYPQKARTEAEPGLLLTPCYVASPMAEFVARCVA